MTPLRRILCPVDLSECSRHALDHAVALARRYDGSVTALHVVQPMPYADPMMAGPLIFTPDDLDAIALDLERFVRDEAGATPVSREVVQGRTVATILEEARELPADLLVLGTHGRSGFEHLMLGSVAERVLRKADCPVLTVPPRSPDAVPSGPVGFERILCAVDFSPASLKALAYATGLASESGAQVTAMHVVEPRYVYEPIAVGGEAILGYEPVATQGAEARLQEAVPRDVSVRLVVGDGKPYREILRQAGEDRSDLIVIGAHGGVVNLSGFFGSTTNHIVREAFCPVLSLRA